MIWIGLIEIDHRLFYLLHNHIQMETIKVDVNERRWWDDRCWGWRNQIRKFVVMNATWYRWKLINFSVKVMRTKLYKIRVSCSWSRRHIVIVVPWRRMVWFWTNERCLSGQIIESTTIKEEGDYDSATTTEAKRNFVLTV